MRIAIDSRNFNSTGTLSADQEERGNQFSYEKQYCNKKNNIEIGLITEQQFC